MMRSRKLIKKNIITFLITFITIISFSLQDSRSYGNDREVTNNLPKAKTVQTYSQDWYINRFNNLIENNKQAKKAKEHIKNTTKEIPGPIIYQQSAVLGIEAGESAEFEEDFGINDPNDSYTSLGSGVTDFRSTVGKSQIIQFAQPIKRLSITDPSLADLILLSPTQMILNGKTAGVTSLIIWDEFDQPAFFDLYVQNDTSNLLDAFKTVAPDEQINIKITDDGNVILSGTVSSTVIRDQIQKICEAFGYTLVDVSESPVPQVILELRIAEISKAVTKNFSLLAKVGAWNGPFLWPAQTPDPAATVSPPIPDPSIWEGAWRSFQTGWDGNSSGGFTAAIFRPQDKMSFLLKMANSRGLLNILAEPKIVSTNGREATFDAGQSVPVPTGVDQNGNLAYEYKDVGVTVKFTPWISEKSERIELKISPVVSEIDSTVTLTQPNTGIKIFGFRKRSASTVVELKNGETLMIAGLLRRSDTDSTSSPGFLDGIPLINKLFKSTEFQNQESELVIMVTPKIVKTGVYGEILGNSEN